MAQVVTIKPSIPLSAPEMPNYDHRSGAAANRAFNAVQDFSQTLQGLTNEAQKQQDALDFTKLSGDYEIGLDQLKDDLTTEPDYQKRMDLFNERALDLQAKTLEQAKPAVQQALNIHIGRTLPRKSLEYKRDTLKEWGQSRLAELDQNEDVLAERIIGAATPEEAERYKSIQKSLATGLSQGPGAPINPLALEKRIKGFETKTLEKLAVKFLRSNPDALFTDAVVSQLAPLGEVRILDIQSKARKASEEIDNTNERITKKNKVHVIDAAEAQANFGRLNEDWLKNAMEGMNPMVRPAEARHLKSINDNPPTASGNNAANVIWDQYLSGPRTLERINRARSELNRLSKELGAPSKDVLKYKNELQSDQTTIENQGIARENNEIQKQNRQIENLKTTYEASVETNPFLKKIMGNMAPRDKARIEDTFRKEGPEAAKRLVDELVKGGTDKKTAIETKHGKALDW